MQRYRERLPAEVQAEAVQAGLQRRYQARLLRRWGPTVSARFMRFFATGDAQVTFWGGAVGVANTRHLGAGSANGEASSSWLGLRLEAQAHFGGTYAWLDVDQENRPSPTSTRAAHKP